MHGAQLLSNQASRSALHSKLASLFCVQFRFLLQALRLSCQDLLKGFRAKNQVYIRCRLSNQPLRSDDSSLRRLGKILHFSKSRSLIVKCEQAGFVKIGTRACDSKLRDIGTVQDLFGPVSAPYVSVRPASASPTKYVGRIAYALD